MDCEKIRCSCGSHTAFFLGSLALEVENGWARHPGPGGTPGPPSISVEFLDLGGRLAKGDSALESQAHFLAVAEHRLVPARARNVGFGPLRDKRFCLVDRVVNWMWRFPHGFQRLLLHLVLSGLRWPVLFGLRNFP